MKIQISLVVATLLICCYSGSEVAGQRPGSVQAPQSMPTVDQILDRYVQAIGGAAAHRKLTSRVMKRSLVIEGSDVTASFESYQQAPNKSVEIGQFKLGNGSKFEVSRGFNGAVGWALNPTNGGLRELSGTALAAEKHDAEFYWEIKLKELYPKMALIGQVQVGNHTAYCIEATPAEGDPLKLYFEAHAGLLVRKDSVYESLSRGKVPVESYYDDYREVDGIKLPFTIRQPAYKYTYKVNEVKHNIPIDEAKFKRPGAAFDELSISRMRGSSHLELSQPTMKTKLEKGVKIKMRDGIELVADIVRPADSRSTMVCQSSTAQSSGQIL